MFYFFDENHDVWFTYRPRRKSVIHVAFPLEQGRFCVDLVCFNISHEFVGKGNCYLCVHRGTVGLWVELSIELERIFLMD